MNREKFLLDLKKKLRKLPKQEVENILQYYNEYFEESNKNDIEVINELDSPSAIAAQILAEYALDDTKNNNGFANKILIIVLAIFAAPVGLPIIIAGIAILFAVVVTIIALFFAAIVTLAAFAFSGIVVFIQGADIMLQSPASAVFYIGIAFILIGMCLLIFYSIKIELPRACLFIQKIGRGLLEKINKKRGIKDGKEE